MNKRPNALFKLVIFAAVLFFVVGCASASTPTPSPPSLVGTWVITVTEENALVSGGQKVGMGQYEVTFADNGRVSLYNRAGMAIDTDMGAYTVTQDQLFLTDERSECVKMGFPTATYKWSVEIDTLTLTAIDDACYTRRKSVGRTWARKTTVGTPAPTGMPMLK